ncbi:helix-turn-helix domain-containing protein [Streptomyces sp. NPDC007088]|uniref:helix-turn-helix domain-containing protein n=1 Tax=Streptomyces sp. NPDC007088 TaxID=3364773 RepID=UPI0036BCD11A
MSLDEEFKILTWEYFGEELKRARVAAGLTQSGLAALVFISGSYVAQFEIGQRKPQLDVAERIDEVLRTGGMLARMVRKLIRKSGHAEYFAQVAALEAQATKVLDFYPMAIPGLLQVADYSRSLIIAAHPYATDEFVEEKVAARVGRARLLADVTRPLYNAIVHEAALHIAVGGNPVMARQLEHIATMARSRWLSFQVLPFRAGATAGMSGSFRLMAFEDMPGVAYTEGLYSGSLLDDPRLVSKLTDTYDQLRADALSPAASLELISSAAEEYRRCASAT